MAIGENLFGYFNSSPEVIRLVVMIGVKYLLSRRQKPGQARRTEADE